MDAFDQSPHHSNEHAPNDALDQANELLADVLQQLESQINEARATLSNLLFEIDDIELQVNPRIKVDYSVKIGCFENELLKAQIEARRAKRKLALAQARTNRGDAIVDTELEERLQEEFAQWKAELSARVSEYIQNLEVRASTTALSAQDSRELKRLHRTLIKRLHPDANIGCEEECERFFLLAQAAYEHGDLELLKSVEASTRHLGKNSGAFPTEAEASAELEIVNARIEVCREKLELLKSSNPYLLKDKLDDTAWMTKTVSDLKEQTEQHARACEYYLAQYDALKERSHE